MEKPPKAAKPAKRRKTPQPELLAGVDVGSSAMRMHIAQIAPGDDENPLRLIEELTHPVSTGADTFTHGYIRTDTLRSICDILGNFLRLMDGYGVAHRRIVASSAVREALNREILVDRIRHNAGVDVELLDAVEESRLAYQALLPWLRLRGGEYSMALNLGGGSTEMMILRGEDLLTGRSRRLGTSRLFHAAAAAGAQAGGRIMRERLRAAAANIVRSHRETYREYAVSHFFLINPVLYRAFLRHPGAVRHERDFVLRADVLRAAIAEQSAKSPLELGETFNMGLAEVENLLPAMMILDSFIETIEIEEVTFANTDLLNGLLLEMMIAARGGNPLMMFRRQMVRSARAVGEKYVYDRAHARLVTSFAMTLFDLLRDVLDLDERDRLLLELAAVLHDIGTYIAEHDHHRHSAYLVKWADIVGLNENDRALTSQIVFYHRRENPSRDNAYFMSIPSADRLRISKLAGILRVADVLDRGHTQSVSAMRAEIAGDKLVLHLRIATDLGTILDALPAKAVLLEQVSGLQVVLRREMMGS